MVPEHAVVPPGPSFAERRQDARAEMNRSEQVAAAVALREAGFPVRAVPRGVLVEGVAPDAPAATVLEPQDVIVAVDGRPVRTPAEAPGGRREASAGPGGGPDDPPGGQATARHGSHGPGSSRSHSAPHRDPGQPGRADRAAG